MIKNKLNIQERVEFISLFLIILLIISNAIINNDSNIAVISAICGITYTFLAGKGLPVCYLFGVIGSSFYAYLAFSNAIWGNVLLYLIYYIPMQVLGYLKWKKNLKLDKMEIIKIKLPQKDMYFLILILILLTLIIYNILNQLNDSHPIIDSITTIFSIGGMYLTVRRAIEQWLFWAFVNLLSLIMWLNILLTGTPVYSTVIMWSTYLLLSIYFYIMWSREIKNYN
jgi:nicotinamide mononucleotide transporter